DARGAGAARDLRSRVEGAGRVPQAASGGEIKRSSVTSRPSPVVSHQSQSPVPSHSDKSSDGPTTDDSRPTTDDAGLKTDDFRLKTDDWRLTTVLSSAGDIFASFALRDMVLLPLSEIDVRQ